MTEAELRAAADLCRQGAIGQPVFIQNIFLKEAKRLELRATNMELQRAAGRFHIR